MGRIVSLEQTSSTKQQFSNKDRQILVGTAKIIFNSTLNSKLLDKNWRFSTQSKIRHLQLIITRYMPRLLSKFVFDDFVFSNAFYPTWIPIKLISIVWRLIMIPLTFGVSIDKLNCGVDCSGSIGEWINAFFLCALERCSQHLKQNGCLRLQWYQLKDW